MARMTLMALVLRFAALFGLLGVFPVALAVNQAGSSPGQFAVDANGAATYTLPIPVPPGINGLEPKLAITYNSAQGNGLLGVGAGLSGLSSISRCAGSIATDGARKGISLTEERFCLDGQRLSMFVAAPV